MVRQSLALDPYTQKTQVLVSGGEFYFSNLQSISREVMVRGGRFSFVDNKYQKGIPRTPTIIGKGLTIGHSHYFQKLFL